MSVFEGYDPRDWLREKTLAALQASLELVDLANEPDTTPWYERKLRRIAELIQDRLVPIVVFVHGAESSAADHKEWQQFLDGGTFAFAAWCQRWNIGDATLIGTKALAALRTVEEENAKAEILLPEESEEDELRALYLKLEIYSSMNLRLLHEELSRPETRLLLWLLRGLAISEPADIVHVSRRFLPNDIGLTADETSSAYRELCTRGLIEPADVTGSANESDRLRIRLVIQGVNDAKHADASELPSFGYPGARIAGEMTTGQTLFIDVPPSSRARLHWWVKEDQEIPELRDFLQTNIGDEKIYVEKVELRTLSNKRKIKIEFRYPAYSGDLEAIEFSVQLFASEWLNKLLGGGTNMNVELD